MPTPAKIETPFEKRAWGEEFGSLRDPFGIGRMVNTGPVVGNGRRSRQADVGLR
jgi:hypothetical protein